MTRTARSLSTTLLWGGIIATALTGLSVLMLWLLGPGTNPPGVWGTMALMISLNLLVISLAVLFIGVASTIMNRDGEHTDG